VLSESRGSWDTPEIHSGQMESSSAFHLPVFGRAASSSHLQLFQALSAAFGFLRRRRCAKLWTSLPLRSPILSKALQEFLKTPLFLIPLRLPEHSLTSCPMLRLQEDFCVQNSLHTHIGRQASSHQESISVTPCGFFLSECDLSTSIHLLVLSFSPVTSPPQNSSTPHFSASQTFPPRVIMSAAFQRSPDE
jgi:hypothetical protein